MRICPNCASFPICFTRSWSESRALFSCPEYVWTTYHFIDMERSEVFSDACITFNPFFSAGVALSAVDHSRHPGPGGVEYPEERRGDDGGDDHHDGRGHRF